MTMNSPALHSGFDPAEIRAAERSVVAMLEDPDVSKRAYAYTEDATFCRSGVPVVQGRQEMLNRTKTQLFDVLLEPHITEGHGNLACVYGRFSCLVGRTPASPGTSVALRFLIVWRKEADGVWRIAREFLNGEDS